MSDGDFINLRLRTVSGEITNLNVGELLEIDGISLSQFCQLESAEQADPLIERALLALQERVTALEARNK